MRHPRDPYPVVRPAVRGFALVVLRNVARALDRLPRRREREESPQQVLPLPDHSDQIERKRLMLCGPRTFVCPLCERRSPLTWGSGSLRETVLCMHCGSFNRQRQTAIIVLHGTSWPSLPAMVAEAPTLRVFNTEASGAMHEALRSLPNYLSSEYFGPEYRSGDVVNGIEHQDLHATSLPDALIDLLITSDVFEHIPDPNKAQREVFRILAPGGRHILTVPFTSDTLADEVRAVQSDDGEIQHLMEPEMHGDHLRPDGILAFRKFGVASLVEWERLGFEVRAYQLRRPRAGIVGRHALVFELRKPAV